MIVMVAGLPGSGKSFFASGLATAIHADYISSDRLRKKMLERRTYSPQEKEAVYDEMLKQTQEAARENRSLVLDATFYREEIRGKFKSTIPGGYELFIIEVIASEAIIRERLQTAREDSEADFAVYKTVQQQWEPIKEPHLILASTNENIDSMVTTALEYFQNKK